MWNKGRGKETRNRTSVGWRINECTFFYLFVSELSIFNVVFSKPHHFIPNQAPKTALKESSKNVSHALHQQCPSDTVTHCQAIWWNTDTIT